MRSVPSAETIYYDNIVCLHCCVSSSSKRNLEKQKTNCNCIRGHAIPEELYVRSELPSLHIGNSS